MARFLDMVNSAISRELSKDQILRGALTSNRDIRKGSPDISSLEEMANDLFDVVDEITGLLRECEVGSSTRSRLERMRYNISKYLDPICCACGESPARYTNDAWYCEKCVEVER